MQTPAEGKKNAHANRAGKELNESLNILNIGEEHTMRKSVWILFAAVIFAVCAPYAHADAITNGTINFTVTSGSPNATGSFVYDSTTSSFSSFTVGWDGAVYNFATSGLSLAELGSSGSWCAAGPTNTSGLCALGLFTLAETVSGGPEAPVTFTNPSAFAEGTYLVTETTASTPEPSSLLLMLLGLGALVFVMDRRRRQLLSPTGTE